MSRSVLMPMAASGNSMPAGIAFPLDWQAGSRFIWHMDLIAIRPFRSDDAGWIARQHRRLYARDEGFDETFGKRVEDILQDFVAGHDPTCERGWIAERAGERIGSIFCVRLDRETSKLRLFLVLPEARGNGLGRRLLTTCMGFARDCGYERMQLWTHESHRAACALYRATGWRLIGSKPVHSFGRNLVEQSWRFTFQEACNQGALKLHRPTVPP